jgi:hypothetical protein
MVIWEMHSFWGEDGDDNIVLCATKAEAMEAARKEAGGDIRHAKSIDFSYTIKPIKVADTSRAAICRLVNSYVGALV